MIRYTDSAGRNLFLRREQAKAPGQRPPKAAAAGNLETDMTCRGKTSPDVHTEEGRLYTFMPSAEEIRTRLYLGKTGRLKKSGVYDNTDSSLISLGSNPRLAGLMCGRGYVQSQEDLTRQGHFREEDYKEYDDLRYTKLKGLERQREVRFRLGAEERPEGEPILVPYREDGTTEDIIDEMRSQGIWGYLDYMWYRRQCTTKYAFCLRFGAGYIIMGNNAHDMACSLGVRDDAFPLRGFRNRTAICAVLPYDLYARLTQMRWRMRICICPDGRELHYYPRTRAQVRKMRCLNETRDEFKIRSRRR